MCFCFIKKSKGQSKPIQELFSYTHGVRSNSAMILNIAGYEVIVDQVRGKISQKNFQTLIKGFSLTKKDTALLDSSFGIPTMHLHQKVEGYDSFLREILFVQKNSDTVLGISISGRVADKAFYKNIFDAVTQYGFPDSVLSNMGDTTFPFVGRPIRIGRRCQWRGPNAIQCSGFGEINWSMHPTKFDAELMTTLQELKNREIHQLKVDSQEMITVIFEGEEVLAKKISFTVKGFTGIIAKAEGSKNLIVYYVTAFVRGRFISCVLSYWTSDYIEPEGLPPLLGQLMKFKK